MTQIFVKYILHLCIFRHLKLEIALAIPASPVYLDPGMHPGLEVKGVKQHEKCQNVMSTSTNIRGVIDIFLNELVVAL